MELTPTQKSFIAANPSAAMITVGGDGYAKAVRVGVALVDGRLCSSGTPDRVRTKRLRRDPRCTLFVFGPGYDALTLETQVSLIEGEEAVELSVRLFRAMQRRPDGPLMWHGEELDEGRFRQAMVDERRLVYEFRLIRAYGLD